MSQQDDQITRYRDGVDKGARQHCPACGRVQPVWTGDTQGGDTVVCCGICQKILRRVRTAALELALLDAKKESTPPAPLQLTRKIGLVAADAVDEVATALFRWLQQHDPTSTGQVESITPLTTIADRGIVGLTRKPLHAVIVILRMARTPLEGAPDGPNNPTERPDDPVAGEAGSPAAVHPADRGVPRLVPDNWGRAHYESDDRRTPDPDGEPHST